MSDEGRRLRDEGMAQAEANTHPAWTACANLTVWERIQNRGIVTAEDVEERCGLPASSGALGAIFRTWSQRGLIEKVGQRQAVRPSRHANPINIWRGTGKAAPRPGQNPRFPVAVSGQDGAPLPKPAPRQIWTCTVCLREVPAASVYIGLDPTYGEAPCTGCFKRRTVHLREVTDG